MAESTGTSFGRYRIIRSLGAGGMAEVFLAHQVGPQGFVKPCVLKRVAREFVGDDRYQRLLMDEARVSALLNHPHIVQTFDFGQIDGSAYMALELVDGLNLSVLCRGLAKQGRWLPLRACVEICQQVADALAYAHGLTKLEGGSLNLVHRDVSPANILVSRQGIVKLADFGIARHEARAEVTRGPGVKGKLGYMAPEQAMGDTIDARADLFAVGIVLAELLSARRVSGNSMVPLNVLKLPDRVKELVALRRDCPPALRTLALKLTAIDPDERPSQASTVFDELGQIAESLPAKDSLSRFLKHVFGIYFPTESSPAHFGPVTSSQIPEVSASDQTPHTVSLLEMASLGGAATNFGESSSGGSEPTVIGDDEPLPSKKELLASLPPPPMADIEELSFVEGDWGPKDDGDKPLPAAAYFGWPTEFLERAAVLPTEDPPVPSNVRMPTFDEIKKGTGETPQIARGAPVTPPTAPARGTSGTAQPRAASGSGNHPRIPAPQPRGTSGPAAPKLPQPGALGLPANEERILVDWSKVKKPSGEKEQDDPLEAKIREWLPTGLKVLAGAIVLTLVVVGIAFLRDRPEEVEENPVGFIEVESDPPGADIVLNDRPTGLKTPSRIENIPASTPMKVVVLMPGFVSAPRIANLSVPPDLKRTGVRFLLLKSRNFRVETTPPGAMVKMDGVNVAGVTPLDLPPIALGSSATLAIELTDHLPAKLVINARPDTATVATATLEPSRTIEILSIPPGAKVLLDGVDLGVTPIYQAAVPGGRPFTLKMSRAGFESMKKQYQGKKFFDSRVQFELKPLPLMSMPMSAEEKITARELQSRLNELGSALKIARAQFQKAETAFERLQDSRTANIANVSKAQNAYESARVKVEELEQQLETVKGEFEEFRSMITGRVTENLEEP